MKFVLVALVACTIMGGLAWVSSSRDLDEPWLYDREPNTLNISYHPEHQVFCATRLNAVDCVFVPKHSN